VHKRRVALLLSKGDTAGAVAALNDYLALNAGDPDAWLELARIYTAGAQYRRAAFCWEELLLLVPSNPVFLCKYAETLYTLGGPEVKTARKYFAKALALQPDNLRALYGLHAVRARRAGGKEGRRRSLVMRPRGAMAFFRAQCCQAVVGSAARTKGQRTDRDDAALCADLSEHAVARLRAAYKGNDFNARLLERMLEL